MVKKSAKDLAFEKERVKYRQQIKQLNILLKEKDFEIISVKEQASEIESKCTELQDWIDRLLVYTEMSKEDMRKLIRKERDTAEVMERITELSDIMRRFY